MDTERLAETKKCRPCPEPPQRKSCLGCGCMAATLMVVPFVMAILLAMAIQISRPFMLRPASQTVNGTLPDGQRIAFSSVPLHSYAEGVYTADKGMEAYLLIGTNFNAMSAYPIGYRKAIWLFSKLPKEGTSKDHITLYNSEERRHIHVKKGPNGWNVEFGPKHKHPETPCEPLPWWLREPVPRWIKETAGDWAAFNPCPTNLLEGIHGEPPSKP